MAKSETKSRNKSRVNNKNVQISEFNTGVSQTVTNRPNKANVEDGSVKISWFCRILSEEFTTEQNYHYSCFKEYEREHPFNHTFASQSVIKVDSSTILLPNDSIQYKLDGAYGPSDGMESIFGPLQDNLARLLSGKNFMFICTGPKSSGKTHTIQGIREAPGILPKSLEYIFNCIEAKNLTKSIYITVNVYEFNANGVVDIIQCIQKTNYKAKYKDYQRLNKIESVHNILKETIKYRKQKSEYLEESHFVITFTIEKKVDGKCKTLSKFSIVELCNFSEVKSVGNKVKSEGVDGQRNVGIFVRILGKKFEDKIAGYIEGFFKGLKGYLVVM